MTVDTSTVLNLTLAIASLLGAAAVLALTLLRDAAAPMARPDLITAIVGEELPTDAPVRNAAESAVQELIDLGLVDWVAA